MQSPLNAQAHTHSNLTIQVSLHIPPEAELTSARSMGELTDLLSKSRSRLTHFVRKHLKSEQHAEDVLQQTWLEAYRGWQGFRGDSRPETWLFGIALNLCKNFRSRDLSLRYNFESLDDDEAPELEGHHDEEPMAHMLRAERVEHIRQAIDELPARMQTVVQMVLLEGLSYQDAASALALPIGTIRSRISRARDLLKDKLEALA